MCCSSALVMGSLFVFCSIPDKSWRNTNVTQLLTELKPVSSQRFLIFSARGLGIDIVVMFWFVILNFNYLLLIFIWLYISFLGPLSQTYISEYFKSKFMSKLTKTGERMIPEQIRELGEQLMLLRRKCTYMLMKRFISRDDKCLEVGCGMGFGSDILARFASNVVGTDIDDVAIDYAKKKYSGDGLTFQKMDALSLPFEKNSFDVVVASHVIEHVMDTNLFLSEINRVLKKRGKAIIVTPNRLYRLKPGEKPWNKYHIKEYSPDDLRNELMKYFGSIQLFRVKGSKEIDRIERERVKKIRKIISVDFLGLRHFMPERIRVFVKETAKMILKRNNKKVSIDDFSAKDFSLTNNLDDTIDIMAVCEL
jgi:2-polyprenyl-3-methyl-5-hydroxy-6-metoxy-1,4-benzoquinol methylase